ncbi:hypothetical protein GN244_ATG08209 [Phytophthora infestans]|uniref:Uncharacterized protein n=1 Tax=Phytophthora infestans TaxID=4787 RepID=A0A833SY31_PHYIN|nr:hypothetical protein GN244_ATG08209 [Phytophthora infestans]
MPASPTTPMSDEDIVAVLTARLQDAMNLIGLQQRLLKERKLEAARQAATQQVHVVAPQLGNETDDNVSSNYDDQLHGAAQGNHPPWSLTILVPLKNNRLVTWSNQT